MNQINQPRGVTNEITTHDEPTVYQARPSQPPLTFEEGEQHNAYTLLAELHDHSLTFDAEGRRPEDPRHHLAELALSAAVLSWWSRWQSISMHRAFQSGASLAEVAAALGTTETVAYERWSRWAETQSRLVITGRRGVEPADVVAIRDRLRRSQA